VGEMNDDQRIMYAQLVFIRNTDINLRWRITQLFLIFNAVALPLVLIQLQDTPLFYFLASAAGFLFGVPWLLIVDRVSGWVDYWNSRLESLESTSSQKVRVFSRDFASAGRGLSTWSILLALAGGFEVVWLLLIAFGIFVQIGGSVE
jgi:hypothetical protein